MHQTQTEFEQLQELLALATRFTINAAPHGAQQRHLWNVDVIRTGEIWLVTAGGAYLAADGEWVWDRDGAGRFERDEALQLAAKIAPDVDGGTGTMARDLR